MAATAAVVVSAYAAKETHDARNDAKKESRRVKNEQKSLNAKEQKERFAAKKREYSTTRDSVQRGRQRGRMSTILDNGDKL